ncbi:MAG TPA: polysaccharide deacetylase family protein [Terriglobales bacterium]|nr:polysaccharide deacetylase family protein [Terriglobales bacterium]
MTRRIVLCALLAASGSIAQTGPTYAEKLGWKKDDRVLILHMDDAGMSYDSNLGIERVLENGAARSLSVMMPCPWVPQMVHYLKAHPGTDAGLHLTLTSEWREYRWGPLAGTAAPGLNDPEGALWPGVSQVVGHATPDEVDREIRAQLARAEKMGFHPTHLDSHMGTLFANDAFLEKYIHLGMEKQIPVMLPGGHDSYIQADTHATPDRLAQMRKLGAQLWDAGLPVLDDLHNTSYGWRIPAGMARDDAQLRHWRTERYQETLEELKPGLTMVIMHCTSPTEVFPQISASGDIRRADMLAMLDPQFQAFLKEKGFIVTTWKEAAERRKRLQ